MIGFTNCKQPNPLKSNSYWNHALKLKTNFQCLHLKTQHQIKWLDTVNVFLACTGVEWWSKFGLTTSKFVQKPFCQTTSLQLMQRGSDFPLDSKNWFMKHVNYTPQCFMWHKTSATLGSYWPKASRNDEQQCRFQPKSQRYNQSVICKQFFNEWILQSHTVAKQKTQLTCQLGPRSWDEGGIFFFYKQVDCTV